MTPYYEHAGITIYHGDCREILTSLVSVDFVLTDPPYDIVATGGGIGARREYLHAIEGFTDGGFDPGILAGFDRWACFCAMKQVPELIAAAKRRWCLLTWNKPNPTPLVNGNYLPDTEYVIHAFPDSSALHGGYEARSRFIVYPAQQDRLHPNEKPYPVIAKLMLTGSTEGETVLDLFCGSGTTLEVAKNLGRQAIGIEIEERYCEIAAKRCSQGVLALA